ncbi:hypothetical protein CBR_g37883 [Chara braunii]|uniref:Reverse transcriptase domain-containing protein n=1 Tax=Chara braunii TaxID=69332 RepID=A0A388LP24_CHABU|nr:hypothetical protein CBR_g37883 [Chara braunii]|eukprot:GBG84009.1 hypothetical protein CBR_g37883 [Chara braunii]
MNWLDQYGYRTPMYVGSEEDKNAFVELLAATEDPTEKELFIQEKKSELSNKMVAAKRQEFDEKKRPEEEGERLQRQLQEQKAQEQKPAIDDRLSLITDTLLHTNQQLAALTKNVQGLEQHQFEFEGVWNNFLQRSSQQIDKHIVTCIESLDEQLAKRLADPAVAKKILGGGGGGGGDGDGDGGDGDRKGKGMKQEETGDVRKIKVKIPWTYTGKKDESVLHWIAAVESYVYGQRIPYWDRVLMANSCTLSGPDAEQHIRDNFDLQGVEDRLKKSITAVEVVAAGTDASKLIAQVRQALDQFALKQLEEIMEATRKGEVKPKTSVNGRRLTLKQFLAKTRDHFLDKTAANKAFDQLTSIGQKHWMSIEALSREVDRLLQVPGLNLKDSQVLYIYSRALPEPIRGHLVTEAKSDKYNHRQFRDLALQREQMTSQVKISYAVVVKSGGGGGRQYNGKRVLWRQKRQDHTLVVFDDDTVEKWPNEENDNSSDSGKGEVTAVVANKGGPPRTEGKKQRAFPWHPGIADGKPWIEMGMTRKTSQERMDNAQCLKLSDLFEEPTRVVDSEVVHAIEIIPGSSIPKGRIYRMSPGELDELRRQLKELIEKGWIRPSVSPYGSPVPFVPKEEEGTLRMCIDYRGLNVITVKNREPLPQIDDLLDRVQGCRYFSKIDPKSGYHHIAIRPEDQQKTTFQTRYGLYEFVVMPSGLCNAPGTFQHAINWIFHDYLDKFVSVHLDDILIFSKTIEEDVAHLDKVPSLLRQHKFKINGEKCEFGRTRVLYLGHEISAEGLKPDDAKVASIRDWPRPHSVTEMRSFLGMTDYYRNLVKDYNIVAAPLTDLTRLNTPWEWTERCEAAFRHLKHALTHYKDL